MRTSYSGVIEGSVTVVFHMFNLTATLVNYVSTSILSSLTVKSWYVVTTVSK